MRAIWKGAVTFGLVNVPVRLYSATESHDLQFHQVRASDGSRIRYRRVAEADGEEVAYGDIVKGYKTDDGRMVVLTDEDFATLPSRSSREISVEKFVPAGQIDPLWFDKSYYLEPDKSAGKQYALLREALRDSDRMALVTIAIRSRMTMGILRVRDDAIVLQILLWPDEVRAPAFDILDDLPEPKEAEVKMADMLVESMAGDFDPEDYTDDYQAAVEAMVKAKLEGGDVHEVATTQDEPGEVVDLLAALQKSIDRAKAARSGDASPSGADAGADGTADPPSAAKKSTSKRTAAKSTAKTTSKKTATKSQKAS